MTTFTVPVSHGAFTDRRAVSFRRRLVAAGARLDHLVMKLLDWQERSRQRRQLLSLDTDVLKDFGSSQADAVQESDKPFWRA
jgi:uncharacterized protein YjiS (DUF1127 family)